MRKIFCDMCKEEVDDVITIELPRSTKTALYDRFSNQKVCTLSSGIQIKQTDLCDACSNRIAQMFDPLEI